MENESLCRPFRAVYTFRLTQGFTLGYSISSRWDSIRKFI